VFGDFRGSFDGLGVKTPHFFGSKPTFLGLKHQKCPFWGLKPQNPHF